VSHTFEHLLYEHDESTVTITMNRPERRNALTRALLEEMIRAFSDAGDSNASGVILAGNGKVFCTGHDFTEMLDQDLQTVRTLFGTCTRMMDTMQQIPQPVVARVHALATGAGCQLVATADLAVASQDASFCTPGGRGGLFCTTPLVAVGRNIGRKRALEMAMSGDAIDARTAEAWGLINQVVEPDQLNDATSQLLGRVTRGSFLSKSMGKQAFYAQIDLDQHKAYDYAIEVMAAASQLPDSQEGIRAFVDKRAPHFGS